MLKNTSDELLNHFHCRCIMEGSSNGQYEKDGGKKTVSMFIEEPDCCYKTYLKNCGPVL